MKFIYLTLSSIPAGWAHEIQIMKMCGALAENDIDVELICPARRVGVKEDPFLYYDIETKFNIKKISCLDIFPGSPHRVLFWIRLISFLILSRIYLFFKNYDILYTRETLAGLFFKNFILELHTFPKKIKFIDRLAWRRSKKLVVLTSFIKKRLIEAGIKENKILIAPDGVDINKFQILSPKSQIREKLGFPQDKILIGYVGMLKTMDMEKGIDIAINSLKFLDEDSFLVLVGGEPQDIKFYKDSTTSLGFKDRVFFIGRVDHKMVPLYLKAFDVLIAPFPDIEHYRFYMSPLKIFEYMASGVSIVASDLPSIREILDENNAVLVEPNSPGKLAEGIKRVLQDKDFADKISKQAFEDVKNYTWQKRARRILEFIKI